MPHVEARFYLTTELAGTTEGWTDGHNFSRNKVRVGDGKVKKIGGVKRGV